MLNEVDDGVLPVRLVNFVTQMLPYRQPRKSINYKLRQAG